MASNVPKITKEDNNFFNKLEDTFVQSVSSDLEVFSKQQGKTLPDKQKMEEILKNIYWDIFSKSFNKEVLKEDLKDLFNLLKEFNQEIFYILAKGFIQVIFDYAIWVLEKKSWEALIDIFKIGENLFSTLQEIKEDIYLLLKQNFQKEVEKLIDSIVKKYHIEDNKILKEVVLEILKRKFGEEINFQSTQAKTEIISTVDKTLGQKEKVNQEVVSGETVYQLIKEIKEVDGLVELKVYYRGIPIICRGIIKDIDPTTNLLQIESVNCRYLIFYLPGTQIIIAHSILPKPLLGKIFKGEPEKGIIWIDALVLSEDPYQKRKSVRIELEKAVPVKVYKGLKIYKGFVKDISQKGIGIIFPQNMPHVEKGNLLKIKTKIGDIEIDTFGVVRNADYNLKKIGLEFNLPYEEEKQLIQFLFKEQNRILSKLKEVEEKENNEI